MNTKMLIIFFALSIFLTECKQNDDTTIRNLNYKIISNPIEQDSLFSELNELTLFGIPDVKLHDSLSFLLLPVEAACPSCRKKTIDSIISHQRNLSDNHFIVISGTRSKAIESYFTERNQRMPVLPNKIFIDSANQAFIKDLIFSKPTIYLTFNKKVYKKITCVPLNVKEELHNFFSGNVDKYSMAKK